MSKFYLFYIDLFIFKDQLLIALIYHAIAELSNSLLQVMWGTKDTEKSRQLTPHLATVFPLMDGRI